MPIGQAEPVAGRTIVIAGRESLNVQPADPAGRQNDGLGRHDDVAMVVEIFENRAGAVPLLVAEQFDRGAELEQLDLLIQHLVLEHPHDLKAGIV